MKLTVKTPKAAKTTKTTAAVAAKAAPKAAPDAPVAPDANLPVDPKAAQGAVLKTCKICSAVRIPRTWHFCNACWDVRRAARAAKKAPASAA